MEPEGNLLSGVAGTLLWLLAPGLGVNANGRTLCLVRAGVAPGLGVTANGSTLCLVLAGVPGPAGSSWVRSTTVASLALGSFLGVVGAVPWFLGESGPPPQRPAKQALMPRCLVVLEPKVA